MFRWGVFVDADGASKATDGRRESGGVITLLYVRFPGLKSALPSQPQKQRILRPGTL